MPEMNGNVIVYSVMGILAFVALTVYAYNMTRALHKCTEELFQTISDRDAVKTERDLFMKDSIEYSAKIETLESDLKKKDEKLSLVFGYLRMFESTDRKVDSDTIKFALDIMKTEK